MVRMVNNRLPAPEHGLVELFLNHAVAEKNATPDSLRAYEVDLRQFFAHLRNRGLWDDGSTLTTLGSLTARDIRGFVSISRAVGKLSAASIERKLSTIRAFYHYFNGTGELASNPARLVSLPSKPKNNPDFLTIDEVTALMERGRRNIRATGRLWNSFTGPGCGLRRWRDSRWRMSILNEDS